MHTGKLDFDQINITQWTGVSSLMGIFTDQNVLPFMQAIRKNIRRSGQTPTLPARNHGDVAIAHPLPQEAVFLLFPHTPSLYNNRKRASVSPLKRRRVIKAFAEMKPNHCGKLLSYVLPRQNSKPTTPTFDRKV